MVLSQNTTKVTLTKESRLGKVDFYNMPFGRVFSDHMLVMDYDGQQWNDGEIIPFDRIPTSPANITFHYGQAIFEGMKVQRDKSGNVLLFRPELNIRRFNRSAERMAMPVIDEDVFLQKLKDILEVDKNWVPEKEGASLYIRPFMIAADEVIGVQISKTYRFFILTCPVGPYYAKPVNVFIENHYTRAVNGGTGYAKAAGNYAGSLQPAKLAKEKGYDQILWTDPHEHKYVQEIGTMNVFFVIDDVVVTPNITDTILEGTTRQTLIDLFVEDGVKVEERPISLDEIRAAAQKGILQEAFGVGTAAVLIQIAKLGTADEEINLPNYENWKYAPAIKKKMVGIKRGEIEGYDGWIVKV